MKSSLILFFLVTFTAQALTSGWDVKVCFTNKDKVGLHCYKERDDLYSFDFFVQTEKRSYHFYTRRPVGWDICSLTKKKIQRLINEKKYCVLGEKDFETEKKISVTLDRVEGKIQFWSYFE